MSSMPGQWIAEQQQAGRRLCLILEGDHTTHQPLLSVRSLLQYRRVYAETTVAQLAQTGPVIMLLEHMEEPALLNLLQTPETNWGWLGSLPDED